MVGFVDEAEEVVAIVANAALAGVTLVCCRDALLDDFELDDEDDDCR